MFDGLYSGFSSDVYLRPDVFEAEMERVFAPSWLCLGFTDDLQNPNDFITRQTGRTNIVVQNVKGTLRAFRNVCTHRFSRIQCEAKGNRSLTCPYHGWSFDGEGVPVGVPHNAKSFDLNDADRQNLRLEAFQLETCGRFVFVRMAAGGPDLRGFLGNFYEILEHLSETCPERFDSHQASWDFNWKLGMDNAAEGYHVPLVHPESFAAMLKPDLRLTPEGEHGYFVGDFREQSVKWWTGVSKAIGLQTTLRFPEYACFLVFPNIVINMSWGGFYSALMFDPIGPETTAVNAGLFLGHNKGGAARDMIVAQLKEFSDKVRAEDHDICAKVHQGLSSMVTPRAPLLGKMEDACAHFHAVYANRMKGAL
ncbi:aromatic ring-hydroxylating oxygenase subunit alpha [Asticcacaulis machinosus]|uniref:Aromatic ring-hydroxylating dioxygenase subunit alpha n=1 Tax=Asticcacaulis machinosus TaxID=2984211 RepID=A0ABT5HLD1_9CAUL|nr:aromatic ring-hydroxylating dioxygenase subunit alpha [Asticcacaulis machinosus]MDC7676961.1 aromatic ring-hydroxylating dioxygenase subunit alpha [Asticcacaulis machinosus]